MSMVVTITVKNIILTIMFGLIVAASKIHCQIGSAMAQVLLNSDQYLRKY